jgi:ankyrin repeat protein
LVGYTPLHWAAQGGSLESVHVLLAHGARVTAPSNRGLTPLHLAKNVEIARALVAKLPAEARNAVTAASCDDVEALSDLLRRSQSAANQRDAAGHTPLLAAAQCGALRCLEPLLGAGAHADAISPAGRTPLHTASVAGHAQCVEALIEAGADAEAKDRVVGETPLWLAVQYGNAACMEALLRGGARPDSPSREFDSTPLHVAAERGDAACLAALLRGGADVRAVNGAGLSALYAAVQCGHADCAEQLMRPGASPTGSRSDATSPPPSLSAARTQQRLARLHKAAAARRHRHPRVRARRQHPRVAPRPLRLARRLLAPPESAALEVASDEKDADESDDFRERAREAFGALSANLEESITTLLDHTLFTYANLPVSTGGSALTPASTPYSNWKKNATYLEARKKVGMSFKGLESKAQYAKGSAGGILGVLNAAWTKHSSAVESVKGLPKKSPATLSAKFKQFMRTWDWASTATDSPRGGSRASSTWSTRRCR